MITVRIVGGLGNQMFLYAYAKAIEQMGHTVKLDISKFKSYKLHGGYQLDKFNIDLKPASKTSLAFSKLNIYNTLKEKNLLFDISFKSLKGNKYIKGYFQTEKYFSEIKDILLQQFTVNRELANSTKSYAEKIKSSTTSCSIHIRRGDYISDKKANSIHGSCSLEYYKQAVNLLKEKYKNNYFFIFSDDISWVKNNLSIDNATYINHNTIPHEDIYLMSLCDHNITANSSFSWWGAWLNDNKNKTVISPKNWFVDKENELVCKNWIQL